MRSQLSFARELWRRETRTTRALLALGVVLAALAVYWRRRAMDAEKPTAVRDHSINFNGPIRLADIERWREQQSKALGL